MKSANDDKKPNRTLASPIRRFMAEKKLPLTPSVSRILSIFIGISLLIRS